MSKIIDDGGQDVLEALKRLAMDAGEVSRLGAVTGRQWTLLAGSLILARAAISKAEGRT